MQLATPMPVTPRDPAIDSTLSIWREGYEFIWNRCRRLGSDIFLTRVLGKRAICIHGREAATVFYDRMKLERHGALPRRVITSLFGKGAVHTLDGEAHRQRKAAFMSLMGPGRLDELLRESARQWRRAIARWPSAGEVSLFDEARRVLTISACAWAGIPLAATEVERRACDLARMVDAFGGVGPRLWRGKLARRRTERWMTRLVMAVRRGQLAPDPQSALAAMARLPGEDGRLLDARTAAIEVLNVIRPTVAISWYVAFAALALHEYPAAAERLAAAARTAPDGAVSEEIDWFMQEVRRFYPFTPYLGAVVRAPFSWRGHAFEPGQLVLLDVYGNDHDPELWEDPDEFRPERFARRADDAFGLIPQGGGDRTTGHRCPGEWITMHEVALALHFLTRGVSYQLRPDQDLGFDLARMPTRPRSGVVLCKVELAPAFDAAPPRLPSLAARRDAEASVRRRDLDSAVVVPDLRPPTATSMADPRTRA
jgi:fatty-acid peroxygenase